MSSSSTPNYSTTIAPTAGHIDIYLTLNQNGLINNLSIQNRRPVNLGRLFIGTSPELALARVPIIFLLCSQAQQTAALGAVLKAQGKSLHRTQKNQLAVNCALEWLKEHSWQLWQMERALFGHEFAMAESIAFSRLMLNLLSNQQNITLEYQPIPSPSQMWHKIRDALLPLFGTSTASFLNFSWKELLAWTQTNAPYAQLFNAMLDYPVACFGAFESGVSESGSLTRQHHSLLTQAQKEWGNGLATRTLARLIEMTTICHQTNDAEPLELGQAQASRGLLEHNLSINEVGIITRYEISAPTDRYFSEGGIVEKALLGQTLPKNDVKWVHQLIWAIDPCVEFSIHTLKTNKGELSHA